MNQPVRTALVTGSARRVGRAIAQALIEDGWDVIIHARDADRAADTAREIGAVGSIGVDLMNADAADAIAAELGRIFPGRGLDLLVQNAATFEHVSHWSAGGLDGWERAMHVNARAPYLLTCALLPMLRISHGCVINISDHSARDEWPNYPLHAASKAALESLTLSGAVALKDTGIRMNGIAPGTVLAPDSWDAERVAQATRDGEISPLDDVISILLELAHSRHRTGEIVTL